MDVEKALLDQNLVLGEIKGGVNEIKELQRIANGRTGKIEAEVKMIETKSHDELDKLRAETVKRFEGLENYKSEVTGGIKALKWQGAVVIFLMQVIQFLLTRFL